MPGGSGGGSRCWPAKRCRPPSGMRCLLPCWRTPWTRSKRVVQYLRWRAKASSAPAMREACRRRAVLEASSAAAALEERWPRLRDALQDVGAIGVRPGCVETAASRAVRNELSRSISARDATRLAEALGLACIEAVANDGPAAPLGAPPLPKDVPLPRGGLADFVETRGGDTISSSIRDLCLSAAADQEALLCWRQIEMACATENAADLRLWAEHASSLGFEVSVELLFAKCLQARQDEAAGPKDRLPEPPKLHRPTNGKVSPLADDGGPTPKQGSSCPTCGRCAFCQEESVSKGSFSPGPASPCFGPDASDEPNHSDWRMPRGLDASENIWDSGLDHSGPDVAPRPPAVPQPPSGVRHRDISPPPGAPPLGLGRRDPSPPPGVPPGLREAPGPPPPYHDSQSLNHTAPVRSSSKERLPRPRGFPPPPPLPNAPPRWPRERPTTARSASQRDPLSERPGAAKFHTARGAPQRDPLSMHSARAPQNSARAQEQDSYRSSHESRGGQSRQRPASAPGRGRHPVTQVRHE